MRAATLAAPGGFLDRNGQVAGILAGLVAEPALTYVVCATERSGSTLLCEGLAATGIAGRPAEYFEDLRATGLPRQPREYFTDLEDPSRGGLLPPVEVDEEAAARTADGAALLARARERGTTGNGVFGTKLMWAYRGELLDRFGPGATLDELFGGARWIRVVRRDKVRQAISLWRAIQTASWRAGEDDAEREPAYDRTAIDHLVRRLFAHERGWTAHFAGAGVEPLVVEYEAFAPAYTETIERTLDWLGIARPDGFAVGEPPLRRQADEVSERWYRDFVCGD
jgi:LPS sulfotransferase NodH